MTEPEIARRCPTCGASIRDLAFFCPHCGNALPPKSGQPQTHVAEAAETTSKDTAPLDGSDVQSQQKSMSDTMVIERPDTPGDVRPMSDTVVIEKLEGVPKTPTSPRARGTVGAGIQRATTLARDVEGDVIHRVQKVRKISSVVMDEAGYDPSLRFVLVAAIVFILFLVIVLLNKLIA
jgi:uncharacterized Zn finger protein (UPF0148 family)